MTDRHWLVNSFVLFGAPYMAYDIYAMYLSHYHQQTLRSSGSTSQKHSVQTVKAFLFKERLLVLHHMALLLVFTPIALLGLENSKLHRLNGLMVLASFFTCRILLFPYMYWMYGRQFDIPLQSVPFHLPLHCNVGNLSILAPQVYWFVLLEFNWDGSCSVV
ncbi:hypothetical protein CRUP_009461 [Coryphaenoides rupestris]|nr:hypothetical protein CRUP_009461 [Coryphaenoides rupestris]